MGGYVKQAAKGGTSEVLMAIMSKSNTHSQVKYNR